MCAIQDSMKPHVAVNAALHAMASYLPALPIVPTPEFSTKAYRDPDKRKRAQQNVLGYQLQPRLQTAAELLRTTQAIQQQLQCVRLPLLILHGTDDKITDPLTSRELYDKCQSNDKTLKLYQDAWHCLHQG
eukprot:Filipodium_phascolosomae@DN3094_c0_g1_i1.p1